MDQLQGIVAQVLELPSDEVDDEVGPATRSEWTSLKHLQITVAVEDAYRVRLVPREVRAVRSIGDLRRLLRDKGVSA
jgi:acyl carrier protein